MRNAVYTREQFETSIEAREILNSCDVPIGSDFHTLSRSQVESLLACAKRLKYRAPKVRNGSRVRYYHDMLQRRALSASAPAVEEAYRRVLSPVCERRNA